MQHQTRVATWWRAATWTLICLLSMGLIISVVAGA
jgi:hypothetical protein